MVDKLRGHRDNAAGVERDVLGSDNHCNVLALLNFRIEAGDTVLGDHLSTAARNANYTSNTVQNQIIHVLSNQVKQTIIQKVQAARRYTVIADEVTDVSNKEQLSIVLRYVDSDSLLVSWLVSLSVTQEHRVEANITSSLEELSSLPSRPSLRWTWKHGWCSKWYGSNYKCTIPIGTLHALCFNTVLTSP